MKHKKKKILIFIIVICIILFIVIFLMNLGIITIPKSGYILYFNINKDSFENVVQYVETSDSHLLIEYSSLERDISSISDQKVNSEIKSLINSPYFYDIFGYKETYTTEDGNEAERTKLEFTINNFFNLHNTPTSIIYSSSPMYDF